MRRDFFLAPGTACQAVDDVVNVSGLHNNAKERGEDLRSGRINLPAVNFLRPAAQAQRKICCRTSGPNDGRRHAHEAA